MDIGTSELLGKIIPFLSSVEDSALMRKIRAPYEAQDKAKEDLRGRFAEMHG